MGKPQTGEGLTWVFQQKVEQLELQVKEKTHNLRRLEAQRNELNTQGEFRTRGTRLVHGPPRCLRNP
jgi:26S proteasome regulatory subunit T6